MFQSVLVDLFPQKKSKQSMVIPQTTEQDVHTDVVTEAESINTLPINSFPV
jgi:hypothetical protein